MKTAVPIVVAGLLLMLLGIGQRTLWAPPETVMASVTQDVRSAPVTVIEPGARGDSVDSVDSVEVTVEAKGSFTLAIGRSSDVEAWVGDAAHLSVTGISADTLDAEYTEGEDTVPDPSGSDLWISEEPGDGTLTYRWSEPVEGDWSILLAADGTAPAPTQVSVTRPNDQATPFALPLIIGGALAVVLGIALLVLPRRRGRKRRTVAAEGTRVSAPHAQAGGSGGVASIAAPGSVLLALGLIGAGSSLGIAPGTATSSSTPPSAGSEESGPPVVLPSQLERILAAVAETVATADAASDATLLAPRVDGAALEIRTGAYTVSAKDQSAAGPPAVAAAPVLLTMIPTDAEWPRSIVALTQGGDNPEPQALLLVQQSPRENYRLISAVQMLPDSTFPTPPAPGATGPVPLDEPGALAHAPRSAVALVADIQANADAADALTFEQDPFAEAISVFQAGVVADLESRGASVSFRPAVEGERTQALLTGDGGAMVFGYLTHTYASVPTSEDGTIDIEGTVYESLTGVDTSENGIDVRYGEAVMMYVPPAGSAGMIRVVGAAQQLLSAALG